MREGREGVVRYEGGGVERCGSNIIKNRDAIRNIKVALGLGQNFGPQENF